MPVGEAFRLPFIEIKPFWREGRPLPYKIQHPDKSKFEALQAPIVLLVYIKRKKFYVNFYLKPFTNKALSDILFS
jgi:hypothetical protein